MARGRKRTRNPRTANDRRATSDRNWTLDEAIDRLSEDDVIAADVKKCMTVISSDRVLQVGLEHEQIVKLIDVIEDGLLTVTVLRQIVSCLVPATSVPFPALVTVVQIIAAPGTDIHLQIVLAKWICAVYNYIYSVEQLSCLYPVLFSLIGNDLLQPYICQLLFNMTKEEHVLPFRVESLVKVQSHVGPQPHILALLRLYANFRPDLVVVHCKYKNVFKSLGQLYNRVNKIREKKGPPAPLRVDTYDRKTETIILTKKIDSFNHLRNIIKCLQGNVDLSIFIKSPIRRILLSFNLPETFKIRLHLFIRVTLYSESFWLLNSVQFRQESRLLPEVTAMCTELQEGIPDVCSFMMQYLEIWDGQKNLNTVLDTISQWTICHYDCMHLLFKSINRQFCCSTVEFMCAVLDCFTKLYRNWVLFELPRFLDRNTAAAAKPRKERITVFERYEEEDFNPVTSIELLAAKIDALCCLALQVHKEHTTLLLYYCFRFYETILNMHKYCREVKLLIPAEEVVCAAAFSMNPAILSQLCRLICRYKEVICIMKVTNRESLMSSYIQILNCYISDLCSMLALNSAFKVSVKSIFFQERLPQEMRQWIFKPHSCFTLYRHPAIMSSALTFTDRMREEPVMKELMTDPTVRKEFFSHLIKSGFGDIVTFLRGFISNYKDSA